MSSVLILLILLHLAFITSQTQQTLVDIQQTPMGITSPEPVSKKKLILIKQKIQPLHSKYITEDQLNFAINLIENLNGKVIFDHEADSLNSGKMGRFQYINVSNEEKNKVEKLIQEEKKYYHEKYPGLINSTFLDKDSYLFRDRNNNQKQKQKYLRDSQETSQDNISGQKQIPFCILIPSFNNAKQHLYRRNINSILQQQYSKYHIVYMDDASSDNTTSTVISYLKSLFPSYHPINPSQSTLNLTSELNDINIQEFSFNSINWKFITNQNRHKAMFNIYHGALAFCGDNQVVVLVDGDDGFAGTQALKMMNKVYTETESMFVYSSYAIRKDIGLAGVQTINERKVYDMVKEQMYGVRQYGVKGRRWMEMNYEELSSLTTYEIGVAGSQPNIEMILQHKQRSTIRFLLGSHLLSFYTSLLRKAPKTHFMDKNGQFLEYAYDTAITLSLSELACKRTFFFKEILYEYAASTGINDSPDNWSKATQVVIGKQASDPVSEQQAVQMITKVIKQQ